MIFKSRHMVVFIYKPVVRLSIYTKYGNTSEPTLLPGKPFKGATTVIIQAPVEKRVIQPLHFNLSKSFKESTTVQKTAVGQVNGRKL